MSHPVTVNALIAQLVEALREAQPFVFRAGPYANSTYVKIDEAIKAAEASMPSPHYFDLDVSEVFAECERIAQNHADLIDGKWVADMIVNAIRAARVARVS